jgi:hypothetical protein
VLLDGCTCQRPNILTVGPEISCWWGYPCQKSEEGVQLGKERADSRGGLRGVL